VVLESGVSTATAKAGDSVYFRTSFPITINNKVVIPVGASKAKASSAFA
jgi:hypothetical protein